MNLIRVGVIVNTFGIKGEVKVKIVTDFPEERFALGHTLILKEKNELIKLKIFSCRFHKNNALIMFEGYQDINLIEKYKGLELFIDRDTCDVLADGYYYDELLNLLVYQQDKLLGTVLKVEAYPAHSVLRIKTDTKEILVPFVEAFIKKVDLKAKRIDVELIEGML